MKYETIVTACFTSEDESIEITATKYVDADRINFDLRIENSDGTLWTGSLDLAQMMGLHHILGVALRGESGGAA